MLMLVIGARVHAWFCYCVRSRGFVCTVCAWVGVGVCVCVWRALFFEPSQQIHQTCATNATCAWASRSVFVAPTSSFLDGWRTRAARQILRFKRRIMTMCGGRGRPTICCFPGLGTIKSEISVNFLCRYPPPAPLIALGW